MIRLTNDQYTALRSLAKERVSLKPNSGCPVLWKSHRRWYRIYSDGFRETFDQGRQENQEGGYLGSYHRAIGAIESLEVIGLAEHKIVYRCCPGSSCHRNDYYGIELTGMGRALLDRANGATAPFHGSLQEHSTGSFAGVETGISWFKWVRSLLSNGQ